MQDIRLSDQALGALMMALQKSLLEQSDITPVLREFKFKLSEVGLIVMNPPLVKMEYTEIDESVLEQDAEVVLVDEDASE
jgi:flagellar assembly factor FliW